MYTGEKKRTYDRQWAANNREAVRKSHNAWSQRNRQYAKEYTLKFGAKYGREWRSNLKGEILTYYSNGNMACVVCGFNDMRALSIDHINGNGASHRKEIGNKYGHAFYDWLKRNNFPLGFQTLCMNCQFIKSRDK